MEASVQVSHLHSDPELQALGLYDLALEVIASLPS